jgi:hypothetical protein
MSVGLHPAPITAHPVTLPLGSFSERRASTRV